MKNLLNFIQPLRKKTFLPVIINIIISALIFSYRVNHESLWTDEWLTINDISKQGVLPVIQETVKSEDTPPVYFTLLWLWSLRGENTDVVYLRLFSVLCGVFGVYAIYLLARALRGHKAGVTASLLFATSPYILWYAQEARNVIFYSVLSMLIMLSFYKFSREGRAKYLIISFFLQLTGVFTHYFLLFFIPAQLIYLFIVSDKTVIRKWVYSSAIVMVIFSFWSVVLLNQMKTGRIAWLEKPTLFFPIQTLADFSAGIFYSEKDISAIISGFLFGFLFFAGLFSWKINKKSLRADFYFSKESIFLVVFLLTPLLLSYLISFIKPVLYEGKRYLILILPLFIIIVSSGILRFRNKVMLALFVGGALFLNGYNIHSIYYKSQKRPWNKVSGIIKGKSADGDIIYSTDYLKGKMLDYYGTGHAKRIEIPDFQFYKKAARSYKRLWFVQEIDDFYKESVFGQSMKYLYSFTLNNTIGQKIKVILYDCSGI